MTFNLNSKRFICTGNQQGLSNQDTLFYFYQTDDLIHGEYRGGEVREGHFLGKALDSTHIELLFHCINQAGALLSGRSIGELSRSPDGKLHLSFEWCWLSGATGVGVSSYVEVT